MLSETVRKSITDISPGLSEVALEINRGFIKTGRPIETGLRIKATVLKQPKEDWAVKVDGIESPFVDEYDQAEYSSNAALNLMGLYEMKRMLNAFGVNSTIQTDYKNKPLAGKDYFVAGTGTGREVLNLAARGGNVIGIDATKGYVDLTAKKLESAASELTSGQSIDLFQCPAEDFPYRFNSFDGISSLFGVINHIQNWKKQLTKFGNALKSDGKLVIEKYGSNEALVFKLSKKGGLEYAPSILQRRDPDGKGILLGDSSEVLPANFPDDCQFRRQLENSGFEILKKIGFLRIAALFPKEPTSGNISDFLNTVSRIDQEAYNFIFKFKTPDELLLGSFMYDLQSQVRAKKPVGIEDFAYVLYVGRKRKPEEYLKYISR